MDNTYEFIAIVLFLIFFVSIVTYMCIRVCARCICYMCINEQEQPLLEHGQA